jgi:hypothetical protein
MSGGGKKVVTSKRSVASYRKHRSRKTPEEVEAFQGVVLTPGGEMGVVNISNGGALVKSKTRTTPGRTVHVRVVTATATHEVDAKVVRSEITPADGGICYRLAIAFAEPLDLIDEDDVDVGTPNTSGPEIPTELLLPDQAALDLRFARTPNRW